MTPDTAPAKSLTLVCGECAGAGKHVVLNPAYVRWLRRQRRLSLVAAAELMGICDTYLGQIENGQRRMPAAVVRQVKAWEASH